MRTKMLAVATSALLVSAVGMAAADTTMLEPFSQDELDTNWQADRQFPSGGVESVTAHGRTDVAAISVVGAEQRQNPHGRPTFYYFEGIKKVDDFGLAVQVDLYVPAEWHSPTISPANVGLWTSDVDEDGDLTAYPLITFRNSHTVDAGFYGYDTVTGAWLPTGVEVQYGAWNTLSITLDPDNDVAAYAVNGQDAGEAYSGGVSIGQVFLNHYNDGVSDYTTYWHAGVEEIDERDQCADGSWEAAGFRNQGQCIRFVNTGQDSR